MQRDEYEIFVEGVHSIVADLAAQFRHQALTDDYDAACNLFMALPHLAEKLAEVVAPVMYDASGETIPVSTNEADIERAGVAMFADRVKYLVGMLAL